MRDAEAWETLQRGEAVALVVIALAARLPLLPLRILVEGDGAIYAALARDLLVGDFSGVANPYWSNLWPGVIATVAFGTGLDVVEAGRVASLMAGALAALLTAFLGARLFGRTRGIVASALVAGHPWLVQFSTLVFTESFFSCLLVGALLALLRAASSSGLRASFGAGLVLALGVVTRPETYSVIAAGVMFLVVTGARAAQLRRGAAKAVVLLLVVGLFLGGRALLIHHYYKEWDFGVQVKGTANLIVGLAEGDVERERVAASITAEGENSLDVETHKWTLLRYALAHPTVVLRHLRRNLVEIADCGRRVFPPLPVFLGHDPFERPSILAALSIASPASALVALLGLGLGVAHRESREGTLLVGVVFALHLLGLAPLLIHDRLIVVLVPIFCIFLAHGVCEILGRAVGSRRAGPSALLAAAGAGALSLWGVMRSPVLEYSGDPPVQKEAGLWLRDRFPQDTRVMTVSASIPFYFYDAHHQDNELSIPWASYEDTMAYARKEGGHVIAAPEWHLEAAEYPAASQLLDPRGNHPGLDYVATVGAEPYRVFVYRVVPDVVGR
jgi:4-amino-4-deoxy-L-arabinose transferase-like glycosyltransferase